MTKTNLGRICFVPRGVYSASESYKRLDVVSSPDKGISYVSIADSTGADLTDETKWQVLVDNSVAISQLTDNIAQITNTIEIPATAGKIWTATETGAEWSEPKIGNSNIQFHTVSFTASGWVAQEGGGYAQQAEVDGITASMHGHVDVDMSAVTAENAADLQAAWAMIGRAQSLDGALKLTAYADAPTVDITVNLEVIA